MAYYKGVVVAVIVSLCAIPFMRGGLSDPGLSLYTPMYVFNYALLLTASVFFLAALPPNLCCGGPFKRNEIYYGCCLLMCCCMANATLQSWRLKAFGAGNVKHEVQFLSLDEAYLLTPFGISTTFWMDYINYGFYMAIIYMIDNNISYRNVILYWAGATLTSELVSILACFTGSHSHLLQYSEYMHIVHIAASTWVIIKFIVIKPRSIQARYTESRYAKHDKYLIGTLFFLMLFAFIRGLAALNGNQLYVSYYLSQFEPHIAHPSKFGSIWTLYLAVYGIPFHAVVITALLYPGYKWMINMSILYAASVLQGTFVFLSYSFYPSKYVDPKYIAPRFFFFFLSLLLNLFLVAVAHFLMLRCLRDQGYFHRLCLRADMPGRISPPSSQTRLYQPHSVPYLPTKLESVPLVNKSQGSVAAAPTEGSQSNVENPVGSASIVEGSQTNMVQNDRSIPAPNAISPGPMDNQIQSPAV